MAAETKTLRIALAGNPNSGKTTLFNLLTKDNQYVGNWPGVTVEKKEGRVVGHEDILLQDLPGVYSLSPYSPEELVTRDYLLEQNPDAILNIVDAHHFERNLYLTTQLLETGTPVVIVLNMMDLVRKNGGVIDTARLMGLLGCEVVEISALRGEGGLEAALTAVETVDSHTLREPLHVFSGEVEHALAHIEDLMSHILPERHQRFYTVKLFERDKRVWERFVQTPAEREGLERIIGICEARMDDDAESIIASERYLYIERLCGECLPSKPGSKSAVTDRIDRIATGRFTALPLFAAVMFLTYFLSVTLVGGLLTDFVNDTLFGAWIIEPLSALFAAQNIPSWLTGLCLDGVIAGVGSVLSFAPQMMMLFLILALLEDVGYLARVAFIMDTFLRRFGLSGKSFIPLIIGSGCTVPALMAVRTIENQRERRMTVMTASFIPCGAKMPMVGLLAGALFGGAWWVAPCAYFIGLAAVLLSGIILKKTRFFAGEPSPFVMELPPYHRPLARGILRAAWDRGKSFIKRAGTVILLAGVAMWALSHISIGGGIGYTEEIDGSVLAGIGTFVAPLFAPVGFGTWELTVATFMGSFAKEQIVAVMSVLMAGAGEMNLGTALASHINGLDAFCFLIFNLLCAPCFAAINAIYREMNHWAGATGTIAYMCTFAYGSAFVVRQLGLLFAGEGFTPWTAAAWVVVGVALYLLFRPGYTPKIRAKV